MPVENIDEEDGFQVVDFGALSSSDDLLDYANKLITLIDEEALDTISVTEENVLRLSCLIKKVHFALNRLAEQFKSELKPWLPLYKKVDLAIKKYSFLLQEIQKFRKLFSEQVRVFKELNHKMNWFKIYYSMIEPDDFTQETCLILYKQINEINELIKMRSIRFKDVDQEEIQKKYRALIESYKSFYMRVHK